MGAGEVLVQIWQQKERFDWQILVQSTEIGRVLECRSMARDGAEMEAQKGKRQVSLWH